MTYKNLELNTDLKSCFINGQDVNLTKIEYNILYFLLENKGRLFTKKDIAINVWGSKDVTSNNISTAISRLKSKIGNNIIKTKKGFGYYIE